MVSDLLNRVGLDGRLEKSTLGEVELASQQLDALAKGDGVIVDRASAIVRLMLLRVVRAARFWRRRKCFGAIGREKAAG